MQQLDTHSNHLVLRARPRHAVLPHGNASGPERAATLCRVVGGGRLDAEQLGGMHSGLVGGVRLTVPQLPAGRRAVPRPAPPDAASVVVSLGDRFPLLLFSSR